MISLKKTSCCFAWASNLHWFGVQEYLENAKVAWSLYMC